jgi:hypothetical protein
MFGTRYVSQKERQPFVFGVPGHPDGHAVKAELADPLAKAADHLKPLLPKRPADGAPIQVAERDRA